MRAVVQRVNRAKVMVENETVGSIACGLLVYLGISDTDTSEDVAYICGKLPNLRIFDDEDGVPNRSVQDVSGEVLLVSQFTLYGDARHGRRPSYIVAARPEAAKPLYDEAVTLLSRQLPVKTGVFQAYMRVESENDGPFTILLDSGRNF